MATERKLGNTASTSEGRDDLAGSHTGKGRGVRGAAADADEADHAALPDLDQRDRRQSARRKAAGPAKKQAEPDARPTAPPAGSPPSSDPA